MQSRRFRKTARWAVLSSFCLCLCLLAPGFAAAQIRLQNAAETLVSTPAVAQIADDLLGSLYTLGSCAGQAHGLPGRLNLFDADECFTLNGGRLLISNAYPSGQIQLDGATVGGLTVRPAGGDGPFFAVAGLSAVLREGGSAIWRVVAETAGFYAVEVDYALSGSSDRTMNLKVNGLFKHALAMPPTAFGRTDRVIVELAAGLNDVELAAVGTSVSPLIEELALIRVDYLTLGGTAEPRPRADQPECVPGLAAQQQPLSYQSSYYGKVDPGCRRKTLDAWKRFNKFLLCAQIGLTGNAASGGGRVQRARPGLTAAVGNDVALQALVARPAAEPSSPFCVANLLAETAAYINAFDLGFGRHMHCLDGSQPDRTACYVENYLDPDVNDRNDTPDATVAMERMTLSTPTPRTVVAFFVYDAGGRRINQIDLDGEGPKPVPESCYACHQGRSDGSGNPSGGVFLPFDVDAFEDWAGSPSRAAQETDFRALNQIVLEDAEGVGNDALVDLILGWYGGAEPLVSFTNYTAFRNQNDSPAVGLPPAWWFSGAATFDDAAGQGFDELLTFLAEWNVYKFGYAKYCRLCHVAQGYGSGGLDEQDFVPNAAVFLGRLQQTTACNLSAPWVMPHARLTDERFHQDVFTLGSSSSIRPTDFCDTDYLNPD